MCFRLPECAYFLPFIVINTFMCYRNIKSFINRYSDLYTVNSEIFVRVLFFAIIKPSRNDEITRSFIDIGKTCLSHEFLTSQICLLTLCAK